MIQGTLIKGKTLKLLLSGSDSIDQESLKQLNGARAVFVNRHPFDMTETGCLVIEVENESSRQAKEMVSDTISGSDQGVLPANDAESTKQEGNPLS